MTSSTAIRARYLKGLFERLGISFSIDTFEDRLRMQKLVYMLQLNKHLNAFLGYDFNMYLAGPYSPELADAYYYIERNDIEGEPIHIDQEAKEYARYIDSLSSELLELIATLIELIRRYGTRDPDKLTWYIKGIKPHYRKKDVKRALSILERLEEDFGIEI